MRVGFGYDVHKLIAGNGIVLGGVFIKCDYSIEAHSDGDVIVHSLIDSLLGASALGDIGTLFPSKKLDYKDIASRKLLSQVVQLLDLKEFTVINVDITLITQEPKLNAYTDNIRVNLSQDLNIGKDYVSCKATTTDNLGFEGSKEGISCAAISLIEKKL